jgi:NADPH2:quinone reductase
MRPELPFYPLMFKNITFNMMLVYLLDQADRQRAVLAIDRWLKNGIISEHIAHQFPLADTAKAHEAVEKGDKSGAVILNITDT